MAVKALFDKVLIAPEKQESRKIGILEISGNEEPDRGVIVSIGPGYPDNPTEAKPGDRVIFDKHAAEKITIDNVDYLLLHDDDLICIY